MTSAYFRLAAGAVAAIAIAAISTLASAQSAPSEDAPANEIELLHGRIESNSSDAKQVKKLMEEADGELRALLERRLEAKNLQIVDDVNTLAGMVIEEQESGKDVAEIRTVITDYLERLMPAFQGVIEREKKKIVALISAESPEAMRAAMSREVDLSHAVSSLVGWYTDYQRSIESLDAFGIDSTDERAYLIAQLHNLAELLADTAVVTSRRLKDTKSIIALAPDD